jgi:hypothetical protein
MLKQTTSAVPKFCRSFSISKFTIFVMHLHIYLSRYIITTMNLGLPKRPIIWNGRSRK